MTQNEMIFNHLVEFGSITPMKAIEEYGCLRLAARISELKEGLKDTGMTIRTDMIQRENRFGKKVSFAEYTLVKEF